MVDRPANLPDYERPPIVEMVLGVQFAELPGFTTVHAGLLWEEKFRAAYPRFSEQAPLEPSFEVFGSQQRPRFEIKQVPGLRPRLWLVNEMDDELVQIQANRFIRNWKGEGLNYPRYEKLREGLFSDLQEFVSFLKQWSLGTIQPNQCEITYVNRLRLEGYDLRVNPGVALRFFHPEALRPGDKGERLPDPEGCNFSARYVLKGPNGEPCGRLHVTVQPWQREPDLRLDLMVRGAPASPDLKAVADFFDEGRTSIVNGFTEITTERMHHEWGRLK
jgi:uncharacterized protein (TIGR04255 family)